MKPWQANRPPADILRAMVADDGLTDVDIAKIYGVTRQAVAGWRKTDGIVRRETLKQTEKLDHSAFLPWTIRSDDHNHPTAVNLRALSTLAQGDPRKQVSTQAAARARELVDFLKDQDLVIDYVYDRVRTEENPSGFVLRHRDRKVDADGDLIRRPVEQG